MKIEDNKIVASEGYKLHRNGDNAYFSVCFLLGGETEADFEEIPMSEYAKIRKSEECQNNEQFPTTEGTEKTAPFTGYQVQW